MDDPDEDRHEELFLELLQQLKSYARLVMSAQQSGHTLQPTALVHEFYLKLQRAERVRFEDAQHFLRCAATMMRQILADHARRKKTLKRTKTESPMTLAWVDRDLDMGDLDDALTELEALDGMAARVVELRYILGASVDAAAEALGLSRRTLERKWTFARAYLREKLR